MLAKFQAQAGSPGSPSPSSPSNLTASSPLFAQAGSSGSPPTLTTAGSGAVERERRLRGLERSESVSKRVSSGPWAQAAGAQSASSSPSSGRPSLDGVSSRVAAAGLGLGLPSAVAAAEGSGQQPSTISPSSRPRRASSKSVLGDRRVSDELERLLGAKVGGGPVAAGGSERVGEAPAGASSSNRSRASPSPETVASPCASFDGRRNFDASSSSPAPIVSAASIAVSSNAREGNGLQLDRPDEGETSSPTLDVHKNDSHESRASTDPAERPSSPAPEYRVAIEVVPPTPVDPARPRSPAQDATAGALEIVVDSKAEKRSMAFEDGEVRLPSPTLEKSGADVLTCASMCSRSGFRRPRSRRGRRRTRPTLFPPRSKLNLVASRQRQPVPAPSTRALAMCPRPVTDDRHLRSALRRKSLLLRRLLLRRQRRSTSALHPPQPPLRQRNQLPSAFSREETSSSPARRRQDTCVRPLPLRTVRPAGRQACLLALQLRERRQRQAPSHGLRLP